jgi:hypothetical protein
VARLARFSGSGTPEEVAASARRARANLAAERERRSARRAAKEEEEEEEAAAAEEKVVEVEVELEVVDGTEEVLVVVLEYLATA